MSLNIGLDFSPVVGDAVGGIPTFIVQLSNALLDLNGDEHFSQCYKFSRLKKWRSLSKVRPRLDRLYYGRHLTFPLQRLDLFHGTAEWVPMRLKRVPMIMTVHDLRGIRSANDIDENSSEQYTAMRDLVAHIVTDSAFIREEILQRLPAIPAERVSVIPLGIDPHFRRFPDVQRNSTILFVGTIARNKNVLGLIRAFGQIAEEISDATLCLCGRIGEHNYWEEIRSYLLQNRLLQKRLIWKHDASKDELLRLYNESRLFILPSFYEGFGIPILEAQACGCPVITSTAASLPEVAGDAAQYCDPADPTSIARAIEKVYTSESLQHELSLRGIENAKQFSWKICATRYSELYRVITNNR
jgi:glycosyltransferase involved in cell wall biosynthesis